MKLSTQWIIEERIITFDLGKTTEQVLWKLVAWLKKFFANVYVIIKARLLSNMNRANDYIVNHKNSQEGISVAEDIVHDYLQSSLQSHNKHVNDTKTRLKTTTVVLSSSQHYCRSSCNAAIPLIPTIKQGLPVGAMCTHCRNGSTDMWFVWTRHSSTAIPGKSIVKGEGCIFDFQNAYTFTALTNMIKGFSCRNWAPSVI